MQRSILSICIYLCTTVTVHLHAILPHWWLRHLTRFYTWQLRTWRASPFTYLTGVIIAVSNVRYYRCVITVITTRTVIASSSHSSSTPTAVTTVTLIIIFIMFVAIVASVNVRTVSLFLFFTLSCLLITCTVNVLVCVTVL